MKKNIIALMTLTAMLASGTAAFAENEPALDAPVESLEMEAPEIQGDVMLIDAEDSGVEFIPVSYISNTASVISVADDRISATTNTEDAENPENAINFKINDVTVVIDGASGGIKTVDDIAEGDVITVYTSSGEPTPLILPPLYTANVIIIGSADSVKFSDVDTYAEDEEGNLVNAANTLQLNLDGVTAVDTDGNAVEDLDGSTLAVIYTDSTKSVPAQTTPDAVVVLPFAEYSAVGTDTEPPAPEDIEVDFSKITSVKAAEETITNIYTDAEGNLMLPLRKIAEALGFTVDWDGNLRAVMLNGGKYSLQIGENSYGKGKMTPERLSAAPEITNDLTYVPVDYFIEILETEINVNLDDNSIEFTVAAE